MTRGKICVATDEKLLNSVEFNGDMYVEHGNGEEVIQAFDGEISTEEEYKNYVVEFDKNHHQYQFEERDKDGYNYFDNDYFINGVRERPLESKEAEELLDFTTNYFDKWFSDYVYLLNLGEDDLFITCENENEKPITVNIHSKGYVVLCFGRLVEEHSQNYEVEDGEIDEYCEFDGYWEMTNNGIAIYDTDNDREFDITEVDECTTDHIVDEVRDGYTRGDIYGAYKERV